MTSSLADLPLETGLAVRAAQRRLMDEFGAYVDENTVNELFEASWRAVDADARIKVHVPLLAERYARGQIWALAKMNGKHTVPAVLFIDTHDAGRAKMAKAFLVRAMGSDGVIASSAGCDPDLTVAANVVSAMSEVDERLESSFPKPFTPTMLKAADRIVTFGSQADAQLPAGVVHESWDIPDPRDLELPRVRDIRDAIKARVDELASRLVVPA